MIRETRRTTRFFFVQTLNSQMISRLVFKYLFQVLFLFAGIIFFYSCSNDSDEISYIHSLIEQGQVAEAERAIKEALIEDSASVPMNLLYADLLMNSGSYKKAYYLLNRAKSIDSSNIEVNLKLSEFHLYLREFEKVIVSANDVLKVQRNNSKAYFLKAMSYKELGDTTKAFSNFQTVVEQDATYYDAYVQLGILASAKHDSSAVQYFDNALSLRPNSPEVLFNKGRFYQVHGAPNKALKSYSMVQGGNKFYGSAVFNSGIILYDSGKMEEAENFFQIAAQYGNAKAFYMLALIYEQTKQIDKARINYERCVELDPTYENAKLKLQKLKMSEEQADPLTN